MPSSKHSPRSDDRGNPLFPFTEQEPFLGDDYRYYGYISGVGAGKTHAGVMRTAWNMEQWNPGEMGAIVAPTTTMIKDVIIPLMREVGLLDGWEYKSAHTDEPGLHAPNGSRALILSADNQRTIERLAGLNLAWWWLDEGSRTAPRALEILTQRLRTGEYRNGFATTTPMGKDHIFNFFVDEKAGETWTHGEADIHTHSRGDRLSILRVPTWANPFTPEDYKGEMEAKEGQTYEREILGRFVDYEGLVYSWFDPDDHLAPVDEMNNKAWRQTVYGVDWGFNNPAAILVAKYHADDGIDIVHEVSESGLTTADMVDILARLHDDYGAGRVFCDPAEPDSIEALQRAGIDAVAADNPIMPGIQSVTATREYLTIAERCETLRDEFGLYRYPDGGDGEKPVDANNHCLDALRYLIHTQDTRGGHNVGVAFG